MLTLLIIAGGKSSRLGVDKRFVEVGGVGLLETLLLKASAQDFAEKFLCVEAELPALKILAERYGARLLVDDVHEAGAMAGLAVGLGNVRTDWALAVSTDMPFFDFNKMIRLFKDATTSQAIIPEVGGRRQMLAAFYRRELAELFNRNLRGGQRRLFTAIETVPHKILKLNDATTFFNLNTRADLLLARGRATNLSRPKPIVSIVAPCSGTGKTTFIARLVERLTAQGIRVGVIKSDAHGFNLDEEGKDSWRFQAAGARSVAVVSSNAWFMIQHTDARADFQEVVAKMTDVDVILTESRTHGTFPAISLWRGRGNLLRNEKVVALFTSEPIDDEVVRHELNDLSAAERLCKFLGGL